MTDLIFDNIDNTIVQYAYREKEEIKCTATYKMDYFCDQCLSYLILGHFTFLLIRVDFNDICLNLYALFTPQFIDFPLLT